MKTRASFYLSISVCLALPVASARADDEALRADGPRVAQVVTLARLAPRLCEGMMADEVAIRALMGRAGLAEHDVETSGIFDAEDALIAQSFAHSVAADRDSACHEVLDVLGPGGGRLLRKIDRPST